jgi:hypothetical protein
MLVKTGQRPAGVALIGCFAGGLYAEGRRRRWAGEEVVRPLNTPYRARCTAAAAVGQDRKTRSCAKRSV